MQGCGSYGSEAHSSIPYCRCQCPADPGVAVEATQGITGRAAGFAWSHAQSLDSAESHWFGRQALLYAR